MSVINDSAKNFTFTFPFQRYLDKPRIATYTNHFTETMSDNKFAADYARMGTSACKKCKQKLAKGELRLAKVVKNPFTDDDKDMKHYHHASCLFETFLKARATTKIVEDSTDIEEFDSLKSEDQEMIEKLITG